MDIEAARTELIRAATAQNGLGFRTARAMLVDRGIEALGMTCRPGVLLDDVVSTAIEAPPTEERRAFAVLLVHGLGIAGLLPSRGQTAHDIQSFLERALLNPLRRARYPFDGTQYDKRRALAQLHVTIDEHLRPLEPSFPRWIQGAKD